ncbi:phospholipid/cholesterol/gamma-HCH transport system substrate-binding protein/cholesterol transport system auxiliary component [Cupriavidus gilardii J11]|uniref:Phospholipid/cholesterol/gamma-HCH transport system substrate-binding protein/cholesterol transport system auxiliary component n=1 Tax=Cupriavidus gilardii J11 TaxID=936133 RepID=A0A562BJ46_9BURK|nr:phospholipid/cholesterol/gamma-HCH transport system substrate-binding protein/cholesterol transport system auxiliary component [Cupriavidus gilardii J11]
MIASRPSAARRTTGHAGRIRNAQHDTIAMMNPPLSPIPPASPNDRVGARRPRIGTISSVLLAATMAMLASACSVLQSPPPATTYDFGPSVAAAADGQALGKVRVLQTDGPAWLEGDAVYYRLRYAQPERLQPYATQRWIESPVRLFDARLRDAVAARGELAALRDAAAPALRVELLDFEQTFDSADSSRAVVRVRATLSASGGQLQKTFTAEQVAASADGAGGVRALAAASDAVIAAIMDWLARQPRA